MLDPVTDQHLIRAERNRRIAFQLISLPAPAGSRQPPFEWVAVVAFYAAVHYVNSYCWETHRFDPGRQGGQLSPHRLRANEVLNHFGLSVAASYNRLYDKAWDARYLPRFTLNESAAADLLRVDLASVRLAVLTGLGQVP